MQKEQKDPIDARVDEHDEDDDDHQNDMGMDTYPLLQDSKMHYGIAARTQSDFPGYKERLDLLSKWAKDGFEATQTRTPPMLINFTEILNIQMVQERHWRAQMEFQDLVMQYPTCHIIGYWSVGHPIARTLDTLCSRTAFSVLLTREPRDEFEWNHDYAEINNDSSRLSQKLRNWRMAANTPMKPTEYVLSTIYMLGFEPRDIVLVKAKFPTARIVGITTPKPQNQTTKELRKIIATFAALKTMNP